MKRNQPWFPTMGTDRKWEIYVLSIHLNEPLNWPVGYCSTDSIILVNCRIISNCEEKKSSPEKVKGNSEDGQ